MKTLLALLALAFVLPGPAAAEDRYVAGGTVRQAEAVEGDLVGMGGDVELAAAVKGDAVLAGGNVRVRDAVHQDLYAGGGNVLIEGTVARNARIAGGNVDILPTARIGGRLSVAGGTVSVRGPVGGSVEVGAGDVHIDSEVGGDVRVGAGSLELGPNARIAGRLYHHGWVDVRRDPEAVVAGGIERRKPRESRAARHSSGGGWAWSVGLVVLAAILAGAFPALATRLGAVVREKPGLAFFVGFVVLACVPVAALVIGITVIGIPLALLLVLAYLILLLVGYAAAGVLLGDAALARLRARDAGRTAWRVGAAAAAALALALLARVPLVGWLIALAAILVGIGAIAVAVHDRRSGATAA
jgi:hypothetical protein